METWEHTGQIIKSILNENNLNDAIITKKTKFNQSFLSKIYTSRNIQPINVKNFIYVINSAFDLNINADNIVNKRNKMSLIF